MDVFQFNLEKYLGMTVLFPAKRPFFLSTPCIHCNTLYAVRGEITLLMENKVFYIAGIVDVNWWEDNDSRADQEESTTNRDVAVATVLAEYVATAVSRGESRPQERTRSGRNESPRQAGPEQGREGVTRSRRATARISLAMAESTRSKSNDAVGIHMSACGHAMHKECRDRYFSSLLQRYWIPESWVAATRFYVKQSYPSICKLLGQTLVTNVKGSVFTFVAV